jgi:hypothetical protein
MTKGHVDVRHPTHREVLERLTRHADNYMSGRGYLDSFRLRCAISAAKKHLAESRAE